MKAHSTAQYFSIMPVNRVCILLLFGTCRYDMIVSDPPNGMTTKKKRIWRFRLSPRYACICVFVFYYFIINIYVYLCVVMPNQFGWLFADSNGIITNNSCFQFIAHEQLIEYTVYVCQQWLEHQLHTYVQLSWSSCSLISVRYVRVSLSCMGIFNLLIYYYEYIYISLYMNSLNSIFAQNLIIIHAHVTWGGRHNIHNSIFTTLCLYATVKSQMDGIAKRT